MVGPYSCYGIKGGGQILSQLAFRNLCVAPKCPENDLTIVILKKLKTIFQTMVRGQLNKSWVLELWGHSSIM